MLLQVMNIIAGFLLAAPKIMEFGAKDIVKKAEKNLRPFEGLIGWVVLILGVVMLVQRMTLTSALYWYYSGSSFTQAIPAILMGLILLGDFFKKQKGFERFIKDIEPFKIWIGFWGIAAGLFSILF